MDYVLILVLFYLFLLGYSHRRQCSGSGKGAQAETYRGVQQNRCQIGYHLPQQKVQKVGLALQHSTTHVNKHHSTAYRCLEKPILTMCCFLSVIRFEGVAYLNHARGKVQLVTVVVLSDVVFFLQESNQKFHFVTQDNKVSSTLQIDILLIMCVCNT